MNPTHNQSPELTHPLDAILSYQHTVVSIGPSTESQNSSLEEFTRFTITYSFHRGFKSVAGGASPLQKPTSLILAN